MPVRTTIALPTLQECLNFSARLDGLKPAQQEEFRRRWNTFLPEYIGGQGGMEYRPVPLQKQLMPETGDPHDLSLSHYFALYNPARDERPIQRTDQVKAEDTGKDPLQKNLIDRGVVMYAEEFPDWRITPNGFPINMYHSLIINMTETDGRYRGQDVPTTDDMEFAMLYSLLFDALVIYNAFGAGGTIDRFHFQSFDPQEVAVDGRRVEIPIRTSRLESVEGERDVRTMTDYPASNIVFRGVDAPSNASALCKVLSNSGYSYNVVFDQQKIYIIPRFPKAEQREFAPATNNRVAGLEVSGIFVVGNIREKLAGPDGEALTDSEGRQKEEVRRWGNEIQNAFTYEKADATLRYTVCPRVRLPPERMLSFIG